MSERVAVIDYGSGNLRSVEKALQRAVSDSGLACSITVTSDPEAVRSADRIVLPGVGAFADCMSGLLAVAGMADVLTESVQKRGKPFLGICVGMQLMADAGHEHGSSAGLGWIAGEVVRLTPSPTTLKVPHMGWNEVRVTSEHPVLSHLGRDPGSHAYFVHSYQFTCLSPEHLLATADYGGTVTAAVGRDNLLGTQFHPEKSQAAGLKLLENFMRWRP
jgi:imidazole glycerol-phosphate synthase subunit HisH